jgi:micrococcal nuclease
MRRAVLLLAGLLLGGAAQAFTGTVTHVTDGDTVWLRTDTGARVKLRVLGIDAPERCQPWGEQSRSALASRVLHRRVQVDEKAHDAYRRTVGSLQLDGEDVAAWMVREGHAWSQRFHRSGGPYAAQEAAARSARRGLFGDAGAMLPRDFRQRHGPCR